MTFKPTVAQRRVVALAFLAAIEAWRAHHRQEAVAAGLGAVGYSARQRRRLAVDALDFDQLHQQVTDHLAPQIHHLYGSGWADGYASAEKTFGDISTYPAPDPVLLVHDRADVLVDSTWDAVNTAAGLLLAQRLDPWLAAGVLLTIAGLNRPQAISAVNYRTNLATPPKPKRLADGSDGKPLGAPTDDVIQRRLDRFVDTKMRRRGTLVGWYEPSHAANLGRLEAWRRYGDNAGFDELAEQGLQAVREWHVGRNPCDDCNRMAGMQVPVSEPFPGGDPPRHPACQCHDELAIVPLTTKLGDGGVGWQRQHHIHGDQRYPYPDIQIPVGVPERRVA